MVDITTDRRRRAICGPWYGAYITPWSSAHDRLVHSPGHWAFDRRGRDWWVTSTPDWDRAWFTAHGVQPPQRFGDPAHADWVNVKGDPGLRQMAYMPPRRRWLWRRRT